MTEAREMAIRFETTRVLVFARHPMEPFPSVSWELAAWLRLFPAENVICINRRDLVAARNWSFREYALKAPKAVESWICVDRDMRPRDRTAPFLCQEGDLVGCLYHTGRNACAWDDPGAVHGGLFRFNRRVVETLADKAPWWDYARSADGCTWGCECGRFVEKVRAAGLRVARAGWCGHKDKE